MGKGGLSNNQLRTQAVKEQKKSSAIANRANKRIDQIIREATQSTPPPSVQAWYSSSSNDDDDKGNSNSSSTSFCSHFFFKGNACKDKKCTLHSGVSLADHHTSSRPNRPPEIFKLKHLSLTRRGKVLNSSAMAYLVIDGDLVYDHEDPSVFEKYVYVPSTASTPTSPSFTSTLEQSSPASTSTTTSSSFPLLPDSLIALILSYASPTTPGYLACVCKELTKSALSFESIDAVLKSNNWDLNDSEFKMRLLERQQSSLSLSLSLSSSSISLSTTNTLLTDKHQQSQTHLFKALNLQIRNSRCLLEKITFDTANFNSNNGNCVINTVKLLNGYLVSASSVEGKYLLSDASPSSKKNRNIISTRAIPRKKGIGLIAFDVSNSNSHIFSMSSIDSNFSTSSFPLATVYVSSLDVQDLLCESGVDEFESTSFTVNVYELMRKHYGFAPHVYADAHVGIFLGIRSLSRAIPDFNTKNTITCVGRNMLTISFYSFWICPLNQMSEGTFNVKVFKEVVLVRHEPNAKERGREDFSFVQTLRRSRCIVSREIQQQLYFRVPKTIPIWLSGPGRIWHDDFNVNDESTFNSSIDDGYHSTTAVEDLDDFKSICLLLSKVDIDDDLYAESVIYQPIAKHKEGGRIIISPKSSATNAERVAPRASFKLGETFRREEAPIAGDVVEERTFMTVEDVILSERYCEDEANENVSDLNSCFFEPSKEGCLFTAISEKIELPCYLNDETVKSQFSALQSNTTSDILLHFQSIPSSLVFSTDGNFAQRVFVCDSYKFTDEVESELKFSNYVVGVLIYSTIDEGRLVHVCHRDIEEMTSIREFKNVVGRFAFTEGLGVLFDEGGGGRVDEEGKIVFVNAGGEVGTISGNYRQSWGDVKFVKEVEVEEGSAKKEKKKRQGRVYNIHSAGKWK